MAKPTTRFSLRRRLLRLAAAAAALSTALLGAGLFASSAQATDRGSLASQKAVAKHIMGLVGQSQQSNGNPGKGKGGPPSGGGGGGGGGCTTINDQGINYHCGPVLLGTTNVYYIWYGDWSSAPAERQTILNNLASSIGGSSWYNIQSTYYDSTNTHLSNAVHFAGKADVPASTYGTRLSDSNIASIVDYAIGSGQFGTTKADTNGVYFVLTAAGISEKSGFLTRYCGWHAYGTNNNPVQYSFVGDPSGPKLGNCAWLTSNTVNGDAAGDAMASVVAHELVESASDPQLNAWYDSSGYENADKCAWQFDTSGNSNVKFGNYSFLIQMNWVNKSGGYCSLSY